MPDGDQLTIEIEKDGDGWLVAPPGASSTDIVPAIEVDGKLSASADGRTLLFERQGDSLLMSLPGLTDTKIAFTMK